MKEPKYPVLRAFEVTGDRVNRGPELPAVGEVIDGPTLHGGPSGLEAPLEAHAAGRHARLKFQTLRGPLVRAAKKHGLDYNFTAERPPANICPASRATVMKLSILLICLGGLLAATAVSWTHVWDRGSMGQLHQLLKSGKLPVGWYAIIVAPTSLTLVIVGMYLALTWR